MMINTRPKMICPWNSWTMPTITRTAATIQRRIALMPLGSRGHLPSNTRSFARGRSAVELLEEEHPGDVHEVVLGDDAHQLLVDHHRQGADAERAHQLEGPQRGHVRWDAHRVTLHHVAHRDRAEFGSAAAGHEAQDRAVRHQPGELVLAVL